jgi:hypothetical protein
MKIVDMNLSSPSPFALSLSKGGMPMQCACSWFDKLTTNGKSGVRCVGELP